MKQTFASTIPVGDLIFASGHSGRLPETGRVRNGVAAAQAVDALDKIKPALEQAGTSLDNIVRIDYWFVGNEGVTLWEGAIMDYFQKHAPSLAEDMPAVSPCGLRALCYPEQLVEITVIAVTPETKPKIKTYPCFYVGEKQSFASAVVFGDLVFCSGMTGRLPETGQVRNQSAGVQAIDALDKVKSTLEQARTSLENILRIDYNFVGNLGETLWEGTIMDYFRKHAPALAEDMPAVTRSGLKNLCYPEELVEIAVIAAMPE
jgi:enamine deaminase RidA (YjgF/YER057c/UK114 family)